MNFLKIMYFTLKRLSLIRILQILEIENLTLSKKILEIGTDKDSDKSFYLFAKKEKYEIFFADKNKNQNDILKIDLESKNEISKKFDNILIFNVLEHVYNCNNAVNELNNFLNDDGKIIGSTPFICRVHNAPKDYSRYTKDYLHTVFKNNGFKDIKVVALGFGPMSACYQNLFDFIKFFYIFTNIILIFCILIDSLLKIFMKTDPKELYPLAYFFVAKK